jgi:hypothetical protein
MNDRQKLRILLPHWIEHNAEHASELRTWAERLQFAGETEMAQSLAAAAASLQQAGKQLAKLSDEIGEVTTTWGKTGCTNVESLEVDDE